MRATLRFRLQLLGGFALFRDGQDVELPATEQRLVAFLAMNPARLRRSHIAGSLWAHGTDGRAAASLRSALWRLRQAGADVVVASPTVLSLTDALSVDVWEVRAQVARLLQTACPCRPDDLDPTPLTGEVLPDWFDDWVLLEREQLRLMSLYGLEAICERLLDLGRYAQASVAAMAAVHTEPLRETAHRALIRVCLAEGNASEALRRYQAYSALLRDELGLYPSERMRELIRSLVPTQPS